METWAIVTLVLGSSAISALLTFFITKMQVSHSDRRLEKELERAREADYRQRRREVRSEPLHRLRAELARMASKQNRLVTAASRVHTRIGGTDEEARNELKRAADDWNAYLTSGEFFQSLFMQYDAALLSQVEEITKDYQTSYFYHLLYQQMEPEKLLEAMGVLKGIKPKS